MLSPTGRPGASEKTRTPKFRQPRSRPSRPSPPSPSSVDSDIIFPSTFRHLALQSTHEFAPTSAILGGMLAQDLLKALSRKETPILNFLAFDGLSGGSAVVSRWGLGEIVELSD